MALLPLSALAGNIVLHPEPNPHLPPVPELPAPKMAQAVCTGISNIYFVGAQAAAYAGEVRKNVIGVDIRVPGIFFDCLNGNNVTHLFVDASDAPLYTAMSAVLGAMTTAPIANAGKRATYFRYDLNDTQSCQGGSCHKVLAVYGYNTGEP